MVLVGKGVEYPVPEQQGICCVMCVQEAGNCSHLTAEKWTFFLVFALKTLIFSTVQLHVSDMKHWQNRECLL